MEETIAQILLQEIRGFREELRDFKDEVAAWRQDAGERIVKLETTVKPALVNNGQPCKMSVVEARVTTLERMWWKITGASAAVWAILTIVLRFIPWGKH